MQLDGWFVFRASGRSWFCAAMLGLAALLHNNSAHADLIAGNYSFGTVHRFDDATGTEIGTGINIGGLNSTAGVTIGPDGNIYVSSQATGEILYFDGKTGAPLPSPQEGGAAGLFASLVTASTPNSTPGPLKFGPDGNLYVSDFGGTTVRVFDGTTAAELAPAAVGFSPPGGITFGPNGNLYVGNFGTASVIHIHDGIQDPIITSGTSPLQTPSSLLFLPDGDLLIVDMFGNQILRYDGSGQYLGVFASIEPMGMGTNYPADIAFDADGNLVVAVLGATNPPDNAGQILRFGYNSESVAGIPLGVVVDVHPPLSSIAWIASADVIAGDANDDGTVDVADYEIWKSSFGKWVAPGGTADSSANGIVDAADYTVWRDALTASAGSGASTAAVPEPANWLPSLLAAVLAATLRGSRRKPAILTRGSST